MDTKNCIICGVKRSTEEFYKRKDSPDGLRNDCKSCRKASSSTNYAQNREDRNRQKSERRRKIVSENPYFYAEFYAKNKEKIQAYAADTYRNNREKIKARVKEWSEKNRGKSNAIKKAYKAAKIKACPEWVRSNKELRSAIDEIYEMAAILTIKTGIRHHVDHIIPLRGRSVSGLHVPWNLQILTEAENCSKSNKLLESV